MQYFHQWFMQRSSRVFSFILCSVFLFSSVSFADIDLPDMGTAAAGTMTIDQELEYGDAYMRYLRSQTAIISDPVLEEYINSVGNNLVANANDVKTPFHFHLIRDPKLNAFAFFGGYVVSNTGLFQYAKTESELASVLAHEIAHVTQRHLARRIEDQARREPLAIASMVGSLILAIASPEAGMAALNATMAGSLQAQINYTRSNEQEADRFGISTLARAGYNPGAMTSFFGSLAEQTRYASTPPPMLLTHPLPQDRLTEARIRAQKYAKKNLPASLGFHLARARVIVRYANLNSKHALDWLNRQNKDNSIIKQSVNYGKALVHIEDKQWDQAETLLTSLLKNDPYNNFYLDAMSDLLIGKREYSTAINYLTDALKFKPKNPVLIINYANVLIEADKHQEAKIILQRFTHEHPDDTIGWSLLSKTHGEMGNESERLASQAEWFALKGNWTNAINDYSRAAMLAKLGSLEQARYDARIDQLRMAQQRFMAIQN